MCTMYHVVFQQSEIFIPIMCKGEVYSRSRALAMHNDDLNPTVIMMEDGHIYLRVSS